MRLRPAVACGLACVLVPAPAAAQRQAPGRPTLQAVKPANPLTIDGNVADDKWAGAPIADAFVQFEPRRGEPASTKAEARVFVDATHLYVAFRC
jgi:hypothetical protein